MVAIISWMAGMLYLPRLFVYHSGTPVGSAQSETFKIIEQRLLTLITTPAMVIAWVLGLWLAWKSGYWAAPWLHAKVALVLALSGLHGYLTAATRAFREDRNTKSARHSAHRQRNSGRADGRDRYPRGCEAVLVVPVRDATPAKFPDVPLPQSAGNPHEPVCFLLPSPRQVWHDAIGWQCKG